jgi:hypothetical protein
MAFLVASVFWFLPTPSQAAVVTQLDITSESVSLNFGVKGTLSGTFNQSGQLIMGQFQRLPISSTGGPVTTTFRFF